MKSSNNPAQNRMSIRNCARGKHSLFLESSEEFCQGSSSDNAGGKGHHAADHEVLLRGYKPQGLKSFKGSVIQYAQALKIKKRSRSYQHNDKCWIGTLVLTNSCSIKR